MSYVNATDTFSFFVDTDLRFGAGEALRLPEHLVSRGWRRLALVVDAGIVRTPAWQQVEAALSTACEIVARLESSQAEPTYDYLDEARKPFTGPAIDAFVVAGGGSTLDLGKALSVLVTNPEPALRYRGFDLITNSGPPVVALPTTAGTGSEVTPNAVFIDASEKRKLGINSRRYVPRLVVLDPLLTVTCPRTVTLASGLDAMVQAIENFASTRATAASKIFSRQGVALVFEALPHVIRRPDDVGWRGQMQLGAFFSGIGLMNGGGGIAGALSYPLGTHFDVPHGLAHAVFTPAVVGWNVARGSTTYADLYDALPGATHTLDRAGKSREFHARLVEMFREVDGPLTLGALGLDEDAVPRFSRIVAAQTLLPAFQQNPVPFSVEDVPELVRSMG
ncbi:MAG: iron-containing alcohol dehydrogenase family protein [Vicinamibacterales bacterium]